MRVIETRGKYNIGVQPPFCAVFKKKPSEHMFQAVFDYLNRLFHK